MTPLPQRILEELQRRNYDPTQFAVTFTPSRILPDISASAQSKTRLTGNFAPQAARIQSAFKPLDRTIRRAAQSLSSYDSVRSGPATTIALSLKFFPPGRFR